MPLDSCSSDTLSKKPRLRINGGAAIALTWIHATLRRQGMLKTPGTEHDDSHRPDAK